MCDRKILDRIADIIKTGFKFLLTTDEGHEYTNDDDMNTRFSGLYLKFDLVHYSSDFSNAPSNDRSSPIIKTHLKTNPLSGT